MSYFALALLLCSSAAGDKPAIAVLEISGTGIDNSLLPTLTEVLTVEIDALGMYKVIGGRDIQAMLGFEKQKDIMGCTDAACLAEIGGALGVDRIVASHIGKVGQTFVVNIKLINIRMADTEARAYETVKGDVDVLINTIKKSVNKLLGPGSAAAASLGYKAGPKKPAPTKTAAEPDPEPETEVATAPDPTGEPTVTQEAESGSLPWLAIGLFSAGAVSVGVGAVFGVQASNAADEAWLDEDGRDGYDPGSQIAIGESKDAALLANIFYIVGGLAIGGGVAALIWGGDDDEPTAMVPVLSPTGFGIAGTF